jgi:hypothetical protein
MPGLRSTMFPMSSDGVFNSGLVKENDIGVSFP